MVLRYILPIGILFAACSSEPQETTSSSPSTEDSYLSGKDFFMQRCTPCHGKDGQLGLTGASDLSISTLSTEEIKSIIENGRNGMAPFGHLIEDERTMDEVIEHVNGLRK